MLTPVWCGECGDRWSSGVAGKEDTSKSETFWWLLFFSNGDVRFGDVQQGCKKKIKVVGSNPLEGRKFYSYNGLNIIKV